MCRWPYANRDGSAAGFRHPYRPQACARSCARFDSIACAIWHISTEPGARPVEITADLPYHVNNASFRMSPDGRSIAYAAGIFRGSSIWRVDLGDALAGAER